LCAFLTHTEELHNLYCSSIILLISV